MSSVPPLRADDLALVAAWPPRPDTPTQIAEQIAPVLGSIVRLEPSITGWRRNRAKTVAATDDVAALADHIERGAVKDSSNPPRHIVEAGYLRWLYPVGEPGVAVMISAGQTSELATSTFLVQIQKSATALRTEEAARALMRAAVDAFAPRWATWTRGPLGDDAHLTPDGRTLGYLNYGPLDAVRAIDPNATEYGEGAIAVLGDDPQIADLDVVRRHLDTPGGAA